MKHNTKAFTMMDFICTLAIVIITTSVILESYHTKKLCNDNQMISVTTNESNTIVIPTNHLYKILLPPCDNANNIEYVFTKPIENIPKNSILISENNQLYLIWKPLIPQTFKTNILSNTTKQLTIYVY